jgi:hypothetical protein
LICCRITTGSGRHLGDQRNEAKLKRLYEAIETAWSMWPTRR